MNSVSQPHSIVNFLSPTWNITFSEKDYKNITHKISVLTNPEVLKRECDKYGGSYEEAAKAERGLSDCINIAYGPKLLKPSEVFNKFCDNLSLIKKCNLNYIEVINSCADPTVRENNKILEKIFQATLDFGCAHKKYLISSKFYVLKLFIFNIVIHKSK